MSSAPIIPFQKATRQNQVEAPYFHLLCEIDDRHPGSAQIIIDRATGIIRRHLNRHTFRALANIMFNPRYYYGRPTPRKWDVQKHENDAYRTAILDYLKECGEKPEQYQLSQDERCFLAINETPALSFKKSR